MDELVGPIPESPELLELLAMDPAMLPPSLRPLIEELRRAYLHQRPTPKQGRGEGEPPEPE